jgi:hypothetical protein
MPTSQQPQPQPQPHYDPRIWITGPMKIELRPEFIRPETEQALHDYQDAQKARIPRKMKYFGDLYQKLYREDVEKALESISN